jgi:glycosyltransferase involved in cell wall biosynthesis
MEKCTIIVNARDRFSCTAECLEGLLANSPEAQEIIGVFGGAPKHLQASWTERFGDRVRFIFEERFLNQAQARNIALRAAKTRLAVVIDNDNVVYPGWLHALITCQQETGAGMVVPLILEKPHKIHTAGNGLYITHEAGKSFGYKELRYYGMWYGEDCNLQRCETDYGELHCLFVEVLPALALQVFDENILEVGECDCGLAWQQAGRKMMFEPRSVVYYKLGTTITADDIGLFCWRWDLRSVLEGYRHFERKWGFDISERGNFKNFLMDYNRQIGWVPRRFHAEWALTVDRLLKYTAWRAGTLGRIWNRFWFRARARRAGYYEWPDY